MLIVETQEHEEKGSKVDIPLSVSNQLPFFACNNIIMNKEARNDISKYIYCKDYGIPPYKGSYEEQPAKWVIKHYIIKNSLAKEEELAIKKSEKK
jgi:hypothetical protein